MAYMIEITESKADEMAEHAEKMLKHGGKLMQCIEELREGAHFGERGGYGRYGMREPEMPRHDGYDRMGERYPREWEDDPYMMGERRGRSATTGRYIHRP